MLAVELPGQKAVPFLVSEEIPYCFPQCLHQSAFPSTVCQGTLFCTTLPVLVVCSFVYDGHSDRCEMVSHCGFNLHFSDG